MIHRRPLLALGFAAPAVALYLVVVCYPLLQGLQLSLTDSPVGNPADFVGLENYRTLLGDAEVRRSLGITVAYAAVVVIVQNGLGLALARALHARVRVRQVLSVLLLLPTLMSPVMAAFVWSYVLAPEGGLNSLLRRVGLDALAKVWLGDPATALWSIAAVNVWMFAGYSCAIFLAGYLALPGELLDAAAVDGATGWRRFTGVEWPLLAPALTVNVVLSLIGSLKVFELPLVMTNGGPAASTTTVSMLVYQQVFAGQGSFAYGAAIAFLLLVVVVVLASTTQTLLRAREARL